MAYKTRRLGPGCVSPGDTCYLNFGGRRVSATVMSVDSMGLVYWPNSREPVSKEQKPDYLGFKDVPFPLAVRTREGISLRLIPATKTDISGAVNPN